MIDSKIHKISYSQEISSLYERTLRLPEWRRRKVLSYPLPEDRLQSVLAYELLAGLLDDLCGINLADHEILYSPLGKPSLKGIDNIQISLSHCKSAVMAAVSDRPVGCDVETILHDNDYEEIADYCYSDREKTRIRNSEIQAAEFTEIWTIKEAIFKLDNSIDIETFDTSCAVGFNINTKRFENYIATIASFKNDS